VSSRDDNAQVADALHAGAVDYLVKPLRRNELSTMWAHVWRRWVRALRASRAVPGVLTTDLPPVSPGGL
jgi:response regulator of citrate/malate metabolism